MGDTREIYWNIAGGALIYLFFAVAAAYLAYTIYQRVRLWRLGGGEPRFDRIGKRVAGLLTEVFGQRRPRRDGYAGLMHALILYGFLAQVVATTMVAVEERLGIHYLHGATYRWFSLLSDVFGLLAIVGLCMALARRLLVRPAHLETLGDDAIALGLLLLLFLQGFTVEGLRIAATELGPNPALARWSPGGHAVALLVSGASETALRSAHRAMWWFHAATAFVFIGYLASGKLNHIIFGALNVFFRNLDSGLRLPYPDIEAMFDEAEKQGIEEEPVLGTNRIEQLSWKGLLDLDACVNCGRCEAVCPAHLGGSPLNPRTLIRSMREHLTRVGPELLAAAASRKAAAGDGTADAAGAAGVGGAGAGSGAAGSASTAQEQSAPGPAGSGARPPVAVSLPLLGDASAADGLRPAVLEDEVWGCRTCGACQQECPMFIEHIPKIVDMRRYLVLTESKMREETQAFIKNMYDRMHPFAGAAHEREDWMEGLDVKVFGRGDQAEYLLWVGCAGALVDRNIKVTRALAGVLQAAGVDFAVLGAEESCTGDPARRAGEELLFQTLAKANIELLNGYGIRKIITACPHCFNTLANEYPEFGGNFEVVHHTTLIRELIESGKLKLKKEVEALTYHDPCYLGRHNGGYDAPRAVLGALSGAVREMPRNRSQSLCCGAGGGYAWMDDKLERPISHMRLEEAKSCGVGTAAVACPFCMQMFEDAISVKDPQRTIRAADIAELVAEALAD
ncbi:MAG: iron-sulfur-binding reductase [Deltaproteobacteria bacterium]|nr:MAG: iron-sulfur-binding reductase [Deltaproteobacteria bacterium]